MKAFIQYFKLAIGSIITGATNTALLFVDTAGKVANSSLLNWTSNRLGVGETSPTARVHIKGETADLSTNSILVYNSANQLQIRGLNDGRVWFGDVGSGIIADAMVLVGYSQSFTPSSTNDAYNILLSNDNAGGLHDVHRIGVCPPSTGFTSRDGGDLYVEAGSVTSTANQNNEGGFLYLRSGRPSADGAGLYGESKIFIQTGTTAGVSQRGTWATAMTINGSQNVGIGVDPSNDAALEIKAGTATTAPIKLTAGTNLTTPVNGALEFDGTNLYITIAGTRRTIQVV